MCWGVSDLVSNMSVCACMLAKISAMNRACMGFKKRCLGAGNMHVAWPFVFCQPAAPIYLSVPVQLRAS